MGTYFLIINRKAGSGKVKYNRVLDTFKKACVKYEAIFTERIGHAGELARKLGDASAGDTIVAVGGDGTVNEVAKGLVGRNIVMGIIPAGSGNGLARHLKIPLNARKAVEVLLAGKNRNIDMWKLNDYPFLCTAGVGFDSLMAQQMAHLKKRGKWQYLKLIFKIARNYKYFDVSLTMSGKTIRKSAFMTTFANANQFGNNAFISPGAKVDDGLIDVVIINPLSKIIYPVFGLAVFLKLIHRFGFYKRYRVDSVSINSSSLEVFHADGESVELMAPVKVQKHDTDLVICTP